MNTFLVWLNLAAAVVVFVHCVCRLSVRKWTCRQPELLAHAVLCGGAVGVLHRHGHLGAGDGTGRIGEHGDGARQGGQ